MTRITAILVALLGLFLGCTTRAHASVADVSLDELTRLSDRIVIGTVVDVVVIDSVRIAKIHVDRFLTVPEKEDTMFVLAQPTWQCDESDAKVGERCLWFLEDITSRLTRKERKAFFQGRPFNKIEYHGRGRMPIRAFEGGDAVDVERDNVVLPDTAMVVARPDPGYNVSAYEAQIDSLLRILKAHGYAVQESTIKEAVRSDPQRVRKTVRTVPCNAMIRVIEGYLRKTGRIK
ncbi:hypothetical protein EG831_03280 [bacterium]|nr:hypothetical protein [bacterium]